ncbi:MAG: NmrA family NAD(P)-binding protein [Burkholderiales bacterium]|nr:NmrA family NAD(P)-binding protein [Burkholderiales bacterium]
MIVVTGAGGLTGLAVLRALARRGGAARAFVHRDAVATVARSAGAGEVVVGDLRERADCRRALAGARRLYHIAPRMSDAEVEIGHALIEAGRSAGLAHFVFHSVVHAQCDAMGHHRDKRLVELALIESGLPYTLMQPTMYMQNLLPAWETIRGRGLYRLPYSEQARMSLVDLGDVAEAAAAVLTEPGWDGAAFELCSGDRLTRVEMAAVIAGVLGRPVRAERCPLDEWQVAAAGSRTPFQLERVAAMFAHYDRFGLPGGNARVLRMMLGREPTRFDAFVRRLAAHGAEGLQ